MPIKDYDGKEIVQIETWVDYASGDGDVIPGWGGYMEANDHITQELRKRISGAMEFDSLKRGILDFIKEREAFVGFAQSHPPSMILE
ncbi:MAG: hypothetical protein IPN13_17060 [Bacteroidetes bacterium]|nr:hypothetical protein [Bacteroidota bacterium]